MRAPFPLRWSPRSTYLRKNSLVEVVALTFLFLRVFSCLLITSSGPWQAT